MITNKRYCDKVVNLFDTGVSFITSWGPVYSLYSDSSFFSDNVAKYYCDFDDDGREVFLLGEFDNLELAKAEFKDYIDSLSNE